MCKILFNNLEFITEFVNIQRHHNFRISLNFIFDVITVYNFDTLTLINKIAFFF